MSDKPEIQQVPIDPDGRYLLLIKGLPSEALVPLKEQFNRWWQGNNPIMFIGLAPDVEVEFIRMDDEQGQS